MSILTSNFFEGLMLLAFGCAWPTALYKSYKSKKIDGKSVVFLIIILFGYICGIIHQLLLPNPGKLVLTLYIINTTMVAADILLYYRNR